jgi:peptidoglycan hydrolase-like protein with peptidoglycan-binding domain
MNYAERDLARPELWAASMERSLARRRRAAERSISLPQPAARPLSIAGMVAAVAGPGALVLTAWHELSKGGGEPAVARQAASAIGSQAARATADLEPHSESAGALSSPTPALSKVVEHKPRLRVLEGSVHQVQRALGLPADGIAGPKTLRALRAFQTKHSLKADAVVGQATWAALRARLHSPRTTSASAHRHGAKATTATRAHRTVRGGGVRALQRALGMSADGVFGPRTQRAVRRFQRRHGLAADGVVGPGTRAALGIGAGPTLHPRHLRSRRRHSARHHTGSRTGPTGAVANMIAAANRIATLPYVFGGGHGSFAAGGYDCSGSVSYVLHAGGLLGSPEDSSGLMSYGAPGPGRHITVYANPGHAFMTIDGRRFDTTGLSENGSRWASSPRSPGGFVVRHPPGL